MELTRDEFLDGRISVHQPKVGFRSGVDAVLLAAAVPANKGESVLELGTGVGVATLCLARRVNGLEHQGLEIQEKYAALASKNAKENDIDLKVHVGDVSNVPPELREQSFDHVFANPPYYRQDAWSESDDKTRAKALGETVDLSVWIDAATRRLKPGGWCTLILKSSRLIHVIQSVDDRLGSAEIKPISPRIGRPAELVVIRFRKGGRADPKLHPPLIMHKGMKHEQDTAHFTDEAEAILRHGKKLEF